MDNGDRDKAATTAPMDTMDKNMATIAYLTLIGLIIAFVRNNEKKDTFTAFHIRQSLGLGITAIVLMIVNVIPVLGWIVSGIGSIILLILWITGIINALNAKQEPVPIVGKYFQEWFESV